MLNHPDNLERVIHFFYHQAYEFPYEGYDITGRGEIPGSTEPPCWPLTVNAEVFTIAEELGIPSLKSLAILKIVGLLEGCVWWKDFGRALRTIYTFGTGDSGALCEEIPLQQGYLIHTERL